MWSSPDNPPPPRPIDTVEELTARLAGLLTGSAAVVCVGNALRGDDGAGPAVAAALAGAVPWDVYDTQSAPESFLMKIVAGEPESVVVVDALDFGGRPGTVAVIRPERVGGLGPSTHGPAPLAFLEALRRFHPCPCAVLGIQPERLGLGEEMSEAVRGAVAMVVRAFAAAAGGEGER